MQANNRRWENGKGQLLSHFILCFFFPVIVMEVYMIWLINAYQSSLKKGRGRKFLSLNSIVTQKLWTLRSVLTKTSPYNICMLSSVEKVYRGIPAVNQESLVRGECWEKILPSNILYGFLDEQKVLKSASLYLLPLMCNCVSCAQEEFVPLSLQIQSLHPHRAVLLRVQ